MISLHCVAATGSYDTTFLYLILNIFLNMSAKLLEILLQKDHFAKNLQSRYIIQMIKHNRIVLQLFYKMSRRWVFSQGMIQMTKLEPKYFSIDV